MVTQINWTNVTNFNQIPALANEPTQGGFWIAIIFMIFIILLLVNLWAGWEISLLASSWISLLLSLIGTIMEVVSWYYTLVFLGIILFMFVYLAWSTGNNR